MFAFFFLLPSTNDVSFSHVAKSSSFSTNEIALNPAFSLQSNPFPELIHCRVAMTAVAGILFPAVATKAGAASIPEWFESNKIFQDGATAYPFGKYSFFLFFVGNSSLRRDHAMRRRVPLLLLLPNAVRDGDDGSER